MPSSRSSDVIYWCVCRRHGGRRVQVKRSTYYNHLGEAETEEERERIINAQDNPEVIQLIREFTNKHHASPVHSPPRKLTRTASPERDHSLGSSDVPDHFHQDFDHNYPQPPFEQPLQPPFEQPPQPPFEQPPQPPFEQPQQPPFEQPPQPPFEQPPQPPFEQPPQPTVEQPPQPHPQPEQPPAQQPLQPFDIDVDELVRLARLPKIREALSFIQALRTASLDDPVAKLAPDALERLRNPPQQLPQIDSPVDRHGIKMYFHLEHASQSAYTAIANSAARCLLDFGD